MQLLAPSTVFNINNEFISQHSNLTLFIHIFWESTNINQEKKNNIYLLTLSDEGYSRNVFILARFVLLNLYCSVYCYMDNSLLVFFFWHCIICPASYNFWFPLWDLQTFSVYHIISILICFNLCNRNGGVMVSVLGCRRSCVRHGCRRSCVRHGCRRSCVRVK